MSRYRDRYDRYSYFEPSKTKYERIADAEKKKKALEKSGVTLSPVVLEGFAIATTAWGKAWCKNIESYQDYSNRLPRGRSYVRSGSIIDLQIERGEVRAQVMGSSLYTINVTVQPTVKKRWAELCAACSGKIGSLVELLQGRISDEVMAVMADPDSGLFPKPSEIKLKCSCPDIARLCKHLAAVLYGIGSRLDTMPELLFLLRGVDASDLITQAVEMPVAVAESGVALEDDELADVFGIDFDTDSDDVAPATKRPKAVAIAAVKKRGRPKKVAEAVAEPPKKRGRPKKVVVEVAEPPKKRGRPKKVAAAVAEPPKKRGRPKKV